ncbi:MAG: mechanosensitive ion channel family protein [Spirochaetaceae bacterium]|jgi:small-conductance mechanosensitive channel|nr:mechanosensitive ion channel family protein [Spirochaetaceae bacterium]
MDTTILSEAVTQFSEETRPLDLMVRIMQTLVMVLAIILVFNLIQFILGKLLKGRFSKERIFIVKKGIRYTGLVMAVLFVFKTMGIDTSAILGAAGVAGIVFGFAAQTSMSSLISGLFILSEHPFQVGDAITVNTITGIVMSIDLLSVKIRTYDNLYVRIPNETIIKSNLITITRFPIRRMDLSLTIPYAEDLERVREVLLDVAAKNLYCLDNPAPLFGIDKFDRTGVIVLFGVWFEKTNYWNIRNSILMAVKQRFEEEDIEIPYQKLDISINHDAFSPEVLKQDAS